MKDFKSFLEDDDLVIDELDEDELSEAMWDFIDGLSESVINSLDEEQLADYVEIIEAVAGTEEEEVAENAKDILKKYQMKDAFTLSDEEAKPLLKKKLISANKGKGTYSITDAGKNFIESVEDVDEAFKGQVYKNKKDEILVVYADGTAEFDDGDDISSVKIKDKPKYLKDHGMKKVASSEAGRSLGESASIDEAMPAKRVRRDVIQKRKASREHRKVKAKRKLAGRRKRKTASFKRYKKKSKRLGKRGLTATGKRKRTFINK